jgi:hypothetical protein
LYEEEQNFFSCKRLDKTGNNGEQGR